MEFLLRLTVFLTILATAVAWKAAAPEPEPEPLITPGFAAVIILAHTLLTKSMMTMYAARRSGLRALRAQASRAPCAQANEPRLWPPQDLARPGLEGRPRRLPELDGLQG